MTRTLYPPISTSFFSSPHMNIIVYSANSNSGETPIKLLPMDFIMPSQGRKL